VVAQLAWAATAGGAQWVDDGGPSFKFLPPAPPLRSYAGCLVGFCQLTAIVLPPWKYLFILFPRIANTNIL
jgi:hypothetical protein